jgi:uncharacterized protein YfaS (alpha-2-macroglobulin family)
MSFVLTSCGGKSTTPTQPIGGSGQMGSASPLSDLALVQLKDAPPGLDLRVSEGKAGPPAFDTSKLPPARKLAAAEAEALLARTRPIQADPDDYKAFALRPGSQPAPRTGNTIKGSFPPAPSSLLPPVSNDAGKDLKVLRWMPEGNVPLAPELSVTFSQPMVAVTSQDDAASVQPVKLSPQPKGKWRWIGSRTILFDPEVRFPQATTYTIEIPAGTKSANGGALKAPHKFTFETPAPTVVTRYPSGGPQHLDVPMLLAFDQQIDPQAVFANLKVTANTSPVTLAMMDAAAIAKDKKLQPIVESLEKGEQKGRWLAFRATSPFPKDATITVEVQAGTPSAEGPNKTTKPQSSSFRTYPPLKIVHEGCGYQGKCPPGTPFTVRFNNPLDVDKFDQQQVSVSPDVPGLKVIQSYNSLTVMGATKARTTYKINVSGGIVDEFGQTLGQDAALLWKVTDAVPTFFGPQGMVVLDPGAKSPTLDFFTTNYEQLKVKLYQVDVGDFDKYGFAMRNLWNRDKPPVWPGRKVFDQLVKTGLGKDSIVETHVDLKAALDRTGLGHAVAIVEPYPWKESYEPPRMISWVQSTKLAVDAYVDADNLIAFVTELGTGKPASGVALEIRPHGIKAQTDEKGLATLALPAGKAVKGSHYLVAKRNNDLAFVTDNNGYWNEFGSWVKQERPTQLAWYVIDDRKMYKPGEEVTLKGWLRTISYAKGGDVGGIDGAVNSINYKVTDSRGNEIGKGAMPVSSVGGFDTKFTLPKTPNLGHAYVTLEAKGRMTGSHGHGFQIEEFRRPEFSVKANASEGPFLIGQSGDVTVNASYFAGGPLGGAPVNWYVTASKSSFTPPNRDQYIFGSWEPWWGRHSYGDDDGESGYKPPKTWNLAGKTDASGSHILHLDFLSSNPAVPMSVTANASVTDVNRQTWAASSALLVHPSQYYVGLKSKKPFVEKGQPFDLDVIGVDLEGKAVPGAKIEVKAVRLDWEYKKGKYTTTEVDPQTCAVTVAKDPVPCSFATKEGGTYKVSAMIVDAKGRPNQTSMTFWVTGGEQPPSRDLAQEKVQIIPDKKEYAPGNTAELLLQAPFFPAEAVISWRRSGIVKTERVAITGPTKVITVPITDGMTPNMYVQVDLVGTSARLDDKGDPDPKLPKRPAYAVGAIDLAVPPKHRTLAVTVSPNAAKLAPGESAKIGVIVKDAQGRPVPNADAAVIVVDEAILSLTGYQFPNPINTFYGHRGGDARDFYSRAYVKLAKPQGDMVADRDADGILDEEDRNMTVDAVTTARGGGGRSRPQAAPAARNASGKQREVEKKEKSKPADGKDSFADDDGEPDAPSPGDQSIAIRSNFNPLAAFAPAVRTDASGAATIDLKLPDNLTRYRIVAIATAGDKQYGKGENNLTARLPLMVRPSPPRFLNFGDTFELPVVVQNQTDAPMSVKVAVRGTNATITDGAGREIMVPANERIEVRFPAAAQLAGTARFQLVASSGRYSDASELALPVWTPATTEAFATYGVIDNGAVAQPVALPGKVVTEFGGLEVTTASTNLQALTDAMLYLVKYPYECAEQRASRVMAIAALRDVLTAFKTKDMPSQAALEASVKTDLERLSQMQNYDGGFTFWERGRPSEPYLTVYVTNALQRAKAKGFSVPQGMIDRAKPYLKNIENHYPWYYGKEVRFAISSYAVYTRKQLGDLDIAKGQKLLREYGGVEKAPLEPLGWLLGTFAQNKQAEVERKAIVRHALNKVSETAGAANFTTSYGDGNYLLLASNRRVDSVMLESLILEQKDLDLIPKVVTGLLAHRKRGRWLNTQENTFALLAMDLYFQTYEKTTPDFVARVWLGNDYAGDHKFKGRSTDYFQIPIPMKDVAAHDKQALTIQKDGQGRLYYRIGMNYAPANLKLEPADYGFVVTRKYEAVDDPKDVSRRADGTWVVKAGARVRVKLNMVNENRRYHVALVDPMPAGFEPMNPALAVTGPIPTDPNQQKSRGAYWWWYGPWYEHQNMRDERVEAFASLLWEGVHTYEYVARATTPGNFVVPPPKAEEMYMPETFGRGGSDRVVVE